VPIQRAGIFDVRARCVNSRFPLPRALYKTSRPLSDRAVNFENPLFWIVLGVVALAVIAWVVATFFSPEARLERRRRRNNAPIVNKARRPAVKFSVNTPKEERKEKR
jgi:hypothetical protein